MTELLNLPAQELVNESKTFEDELMALHEEGAVVTGIVGRAAIMGSHGHLYPLPLTDPTTKERLQVTAILPTEHWTTDEALQNNLSSDAPRYPRLYIPGDGDLAYIGHPSDPSMQEISKDALGIQQRWLGHIPVRTLSIGAQVKLDSLSPDTSGRAWFHFSPGEFRAFATPRSYQRAMYPKEFLPGSDYVAFDRARYLRIPTAPLKDISEILHD